jgi:hypothetical protein
MGGSAYFKPTQLYLEFHVDTSLPIHHPHFHWFAFLSTYHTSAIMALDNKLHGQGCRRASPKFKWNHIHRVALHLMHDTEEGFSLASIDRRGSLPQDIQR